MTPADSSPPAPNPVLEATRWAPSAGNRRLHRFVVVQDPLTLRVLRMVAPGMFRRPAVVVVICIDQGRPVSFGVRPTGKGLYVDVGTAAQTMLLAAHSLGLGGGVVRPSVRSRSARC